MRAATGAHADAGRTPGPRSASGKARTRIRAVADGASKAGDHYWGSMFEPRHDARRQLADRHPARAAERPIALVRGQAPAVIGVTRPGGRGRPTTGAGAV